LAHLFKTYQLAFVLQGKRMKIKNINLFSILDSRGYPSLAGSLELSSGKKVFASIPSGASVGKYEALELRDEDGMGLDVAIEVFNKKISLTLLGEFPDFVSVDKKLIELDGTRDKSFLGANNTLLASILVLRAQAAAQELEEFELISKTFGLAPRIPLIRANLLNGGAHALNGMSVQEIMIQPCEVETFEEQQNIITKVYHELKTILRARGISVAVGDEGGFAPTINALGVFSKERVVLGLLMEAVGALGLQDKVKICLDVAASEFFDGSRGSYVVDGELLSFVELVDQYKKLTKEYPICSIEDGLDQDDWTGWEHLTKSLGGDIQLVGDDLFVTQENRLKLGAMKNIANAVIIKPNQVGTISEAVDAVRFAKKNGMAVVPSHRSGETNDSFIADLAVGVGADSIKIGAPARGERVAKYNRLAEIYKIIGSKADT
jgi:enolase